MNEEIKNEEVEQMNPTDGDNGWTKELEVRKEAAKTGKSMMTVLMGVIAINLVITQVSKSSPVSPAFGWIITIINIVASVIAIAKLSRAKMPYISIVSRLVLVVIAQIAVLSIESNITSMNQSSFESTIAILAIIGIVSFALTVWFFIDYFKFNERFARINPEQNPNYTE